MRCLPCRARSCLKPARPRRRPRIFPPGSSKPSISALRAAEMPFARRRDAVMNTVFRYFSRALAFALLCMPLLASAQQVGLPAWTSTPTAGGGQSYSLSLLSLLRQALGTQTAPPNQVMVGLALFLTLFVMGPVLDKIYTEAYQPLSENKITMQQALDKGAAPLKTFMLKQTRESDLALYVKLSNGAQLRTPDDVPLRVLVPAFVTSELKTAFQISFAIFIPFLIIDMVVASVLMSMGMMMVSPAIVSLPFKLMLFVLVDGWQLLIGSLAQSFY